MLAPSADSLVMETTPGITSGECKWGLVPACLTCLRHHHGGGPQSVHSLIYPVPMALSQRYPVPHTTTLYRYLQSVRGGGIDLLSLILNRGITTSQKITIPIMAKL